LAVPTTKRRLTDERDVEDASASTAWPTGSLAAGSPFDAAVSGFSGDVLEEGGAELLTDPDVAQMGLGSGGLARVGDEEVNTHALESLKGDMAFTLLDGHEPRGGAEVVLGASTLDAAGVGIGDQVDIDGAGGSLRATVVGTAVFPVVDERSSPGRGVLLGRDDLETISSPDELNADVLIKWADGVDTEAANAELGERTETEVFAPRLPSEVNNLREVKALPRALATFLALLAVLAAVHALVSTVRMRRKELAVLRALGFERRQLGSVLAWQATTIGLTGLVVGVPLGLVAGRVVWKAVASGIGVVDEPATPALVVVAVSLAALVVVNAAAIFPGRSARHVRPATVLRSG
jgi:putative ABC transport system permease protein